MNSSKSFIDLHIHSTFSDGVYTPSELVEKASRLGISALAIADHDSLGGIADAMEAGKKHGIEIIPAVELSVQFKSYQDVHLLAYGHDYQNRFFNERLDGFRRARESRNEQILERVNQMLLSEGRTKIPLATVCAFAADAIGRPHIARALLEQRYVTSVEDAFRRYLKPCNVPKLYWEMDNAICAVQQAGGVAVLAHPTSISSDMNELRAILDELVLIGLDGIEVFNNMALPEEQELLRRYAINQGLLITAGSDYHGIEEGLEIGRGRGGMRFPASLLTPLKERFNTSTK